MLKKWREPASPGYFVTEAVDEEDELETFTWDGREDGEPTFGEQLLEDQRRALAELLRQYQSTLTKVLGCMHLAQHTIPMRGHSDSPSFLPAAVRLQGGCATRVVDAGTGSDRANVERLGSPNSGGMEG